VIQPRIRADQKLFVLLAILASACDPKVVVGTWTCPVPDASVLTSIDVPWSTGFETSFCDYTRTGGFCYGDPDATYQIVDTPAHSGRRAAAFFVTSDSSRNGYEARCVLQGALPPEASYGVWFYLPTLARNTDNWNLVHFQGGAPNNWHGLWDVSLATAADGGLYLRVFDGLRGVYRVPSPTMPVPIGQWFHVEFRLKRAKDATGEVALYQSGVLLLELTGVITDDSDLAQWYVGNLAKGLVPTDSTLYVDDVTIRPPS